MSVADPHAIPPPRIPRVRYPRCVRSSLIVARARDAKSAGPGGEADTVRRTGISARDAPCVCVAFAPGLHRLRLRGLHPHHPRSITRACAAVCAPLLVHAEPTVQVEPTPISIMHWGWLLQGELSATARYVGWAILLKRSWGFDAHGAGHSPQDPPAPVRSEPLATTPAREST
jgi:hypothetical protein